MFLVLLALSISGLNQIMRVSSEQVSKISPPGLFPYGAMGILDENSENLVDLIVSNYKVGQVITSHL